MRAAPFALAAALALPHAAFATVATLVQTAQVSADNPDTGPIVTLPGFDPTLGDLLEVTLRYSGDARITSNVRNYPGNTAPITLVPVIGIVADDFAGFRFSTAPVTLPAQSGPVEAGFAFDQTEGLPLLPSGPVSLSSWIVADVVCGDCVADGFGVVGGQATLTMAYNDPAAVPEPSSFSLLAGWGGAFLGLSWLAGLAAFAGSPRRPSAGL